MNRRAVLTMSGALGAATLLAAAPRSFAGTPIVAADAFRHGMLIGGSFTRAASQVALRQAADMHVRQFAQFETGEQIALAQVLMNSNSPNPPLAPMDAQRTSALNSLRGRTGKDFDLTYVQAEIIGHRDLLQLCDNYLNTPTADPALHPVAILSRPTIQAHLTLLEELQHRLQA